MSNKAAKILDQPAQKARRRGGWWSVALLGALLVLPVELTLAKEPPRRESPRRESTATKRTKESSSSKASTRASSSSSRSSRSQPKAGSSSSRSQPKASSSPSRSQPRASSRPVARSRSTAAERSPATRSRPSAGPTVVRREAITRERANRRTPETRRDTPRRESRYEIKGANPDHGHVATTRHTDHGDRGHGGYGKRDRRRGHHRHGHPYRHRHYYGCGHYGYSLGFGFGYPWWPLHLGLALDYAPDVYVYDVDGVDGPETYRQARQGAVDLDVRPETAEIYVDGYYVGVADQFDGFPTYLWLDEGTYEIAFYKPGHETIYRQITIYPGVTIAIDDRMRPGQAVLPTPPAEDYPSAGEAAAPAGADLGDEGRIVVAATPGDAAVYLDGHFVGTAAELADLTAGLIVEPGDHVVDVIRPGYENQRLPVSVAAGERIDLEMDLDRP